MNIKTFENSEMLSALNGANSILLCTHVSPDGDAIGSMLCMGELLRKMGKETAMVSSDGIPQKYRFLIGADRVLLPNEIAGRAFDLAFALDAGDLDRVGYAKEAYLSAPMRIQIDHHATNPKYALINEVDSHAGATGCIVVRMARALNIPLDVEMAKCIYAAISSDTGNFSFSNADAEVFAVMAELMETGLPLAELSRKMHLIREREHVELLRCALNSLRFFSQGRATGMRLLKNDYAQAKARPEHSDKIVNYGIDLPDVSIAYLADDREEGKTKFSLRAQPPCDVGKLALNFGGGGHALAAGCTILEPIDKACSMIEKAIEEQLRETL